MVLGWILPGDRRFWNVMINQWKWFMIRYRWMMSFFLRFSLRRKSGWEIAKTVWFAIGRQQWQQQLSLSSSSPMTTQVEQYPFHISSFHQTPIESFPGIYVFVIIVTILVIYPTLLLRRLKNSLPTSNRTIVINLNRLRVLHRFPPLSLF